MCWFKFLFKNICFTS